ncbi:MAG: hypothetical protein L6R39_003358 [Caloplaca ligustica]|nr:MAG: hypothetical protein L6R39_003358 [Caloplaca ligustica]
MSSNPRTQYYPTSINQIRRREYPLLNRQSPSGLPHLESQLIFETETTYLDHAGTTPYPQSSMRDYCKLMKTSLLGNPHSESASSLLSTHLVETARRRMLAFFRADPEHFDLIFVANATAAIKLVAECIRDQGFWYGYHADAHTSLVGLRELASAGSRCFYSDAEVDEWLLHGANFQDAGKKKAGSIAMGLFAYPAQSNMNGRRLPLDWPARLRASTENEDNKRRVHTLLDAAAYTATAQLDLSDHAHAPDFTALSFYKIFGFPDLGALIVRKDAGHVLLDRPYFGGGTVDMVVNGTRQAWHATKQGALHEALEDGTPAFHSIAALHCALDVHTTLYGSMDNVSQHANLLAAMMYDQMSTLTHTNGIPLCTVYKGRTADYKDRKTQGPTIAFNLRDSQGDWIGKSHFERLANANNIQLRTGGVCNPGGIASYLNMSPEEMRENYAEGLRCGNGIDEMNGKPTGIIRVSFGAMSNRKDVETFMSFLKRFVDKATSWVVPQESEDVIDAPDDCEKKVETFPGATMDPGFYTSEPHSKKQKRLMEILHVLRRLTCR